MQEKPYSPLEHIARSVWLCGFYRDGLFTMLTCYFDDAGGADHGYTLVAGWIATVGQWETFSEDWEELLLAHGIECFHMKKFSQWKDPFHCWCEEKRRTFIRGACQIIKKNIQFGFASIVHHGSYCRVNETYTLKDYTRSEYALAGITAVRASHDWAAKNRPGFPMEFFFDQGTPGSGGLTELMLEELRCAPIFKSPCSQDGHRPVLPLQAADFLAYEVRKVQRDDPNEVWPIEKYRMSLRMLVSVDSDWGQYTEQNLIDLCERHPRIDRRSA